MPGSRFIRFLITIHSRAHELPPTTERDTQFITFSLRARQPHFLSRLGALATATLLYAIDCRLMGEDFLSAGFRIFIPWLLASPSFA